ncbi:MAG: hypothetical protein EXS09_21755 [Gemmataceae bacterium]|nr:hypothetical protein [Gemmataceae bacterium]
MQILYKPIAVLPLIVAVCAACYFLTADSISPAVAIDRDNWQIPQLIVDDEYQTPVTISNDSDSELEVVGIGNL